MLAGVLSSGRERQQGIPIQPGAIQGTAVGDAGGALGEGAGLVECDRVGLAETLHYHGGLQQDAVASGVGCGRQQRRHCRQPGTGLFHVEHLRLCLRDAPATETVPAPVRRYGSRSAPARSTRTRRSRLAGALGYARGRGVLGARGRCGRTAALTAADHPLVDRRGDHEGHGEAAQECRPEQGVRQAGVHRPGRRAMLSPTNSITAIETVSAAGALSLTLSGILEFLGAAA